MFFSTTIAFGFSPNVCSRVEDKAYKGFQDTDKPESGRYTEFHDQFGAERQPGVTFEGKRYDLNTFPDELKELVRGMQVLMPVAHARRHPEGAGCRSAESGGTTQ